MGYLDKIKETAVTQILAKEMVLNDLLKDEFMKELESKLGKKYKDIVVSDLRLILIPESKNSDTKKEKKGDIIQLTPLEFIRFEQPTPDHYRDKVIVITSNTGEKIDLLLDKDLEKKV